jgi:glycosyltransferase involved in cell wall biosynthesis
MVPARRRAQPASGAREGCLRMIDRLYRRFLMPRIALFRQRLKAELGHELKAELKPELKPELKAELRSELRSELTAELTAKLTAELTATLTSRLTAELELRLLLDRQHSAILADMRALTDDAARQERAAHWRRHLRRLIRLAAGLEAEPAQPPAMDDLMPEVAYLRENDDALRPVFQSLQGQRVLYAGQAYYNAWYLSRALRERGWKADVLNWDSNPSTQIYYHGQDFMFGDEGLRSPDECLAFYVSGLYGYDVFHFSNAHGICFGFTLQAAFEQRFGLHSEIDLLKRLGKKIVYTNNGCLDGVSQSSFARWGQVPVCSICRWRNEPAVCSDERNLRWGKFRNSVADYQCLLGGNRTDYNDDPRVHEVPEFYCLDESVWHPLLEIPDRFRLPPVPPGTVWLYHAVGHKADRTSEDGVNIKSSHVYLPLIEKLQADGHLLALYEPSGVPNKDLRFMQAQVDIFLDMLTYGWFGANAREAMMLGKPVVCYLRPEWLESLRAEIPDYADELPIVDATPETVEAVLLDLIANPQKRAEIGRRSRAFALKWHSSQAAGRRFDEVYRKLLSGDPLFRRDTAGEPGNG